MSLFNIEAAILSIAKAITGADDEVWQDYTPTFTGFTLGNGVINMAKYKVDLRNKMCYVDLFVTLGTTSSMGASFSGISLPVPADGAVYLNSSNQVGLGNLGDTGVTNYISAVRIESTTTARLVLINVAGTNALSAGITTTGPHSWGSADTFQAQFAYKIP